MKTCYIIAAGDAEKIIIERNEEDLVIACDAGLKHCEKNNIVPDMIIGDFDSLGYIPENENTIVLPVAKDDTDTSFAVKFAMDRGYNRFVIYAGTGGRRPEHTYANIALLAYISKKGSQGYLACDNCTVTSVTDSKISFKSGLKGDISVFSFDNESAGVTEKGLLYAFSDAVLENSIVTGISNSFTGQESSVSVKRGTLIVYFSGNFSDATIDKI